VFFAWSRETRADGGLGWLEAARRTNFAALVGSHPDAGTPEQAAAGQPATGGDSENVDDDEHLAAYNAFLARINKQPDP
jgi:hypothetical protein